MDRKLILCLFAFLVVNRAEDLASCVACSKIKPIGNTTNGDAKNGQFESQTITELTKLGYYTIKLSLSQKNITSLDRKAFLYLSCLTELDLSGNNIKTIHYDVFQDMTNLKFLNLSGNKIECLHNSTFYHLVNLEVLDLSYNEICDIGENAFASLTNLRKLILSHNNIEMIKNKIPFSDLLNLRELDLSYNQFTVLSTNFIRNLGSLEILNLASNYIIIFSIGDYEFPRIIMLNLSNNSVGFIDVEGLKERFTNESFTIDLNLNKFSCSILERILNDFKKFGIEFALGRHSTSNDHLDNILCVKQRESDIFNIVMGVIFVLVMFGLIYCVDQTVGYGLIKNMFQRCRK
ncbi:hypothetical protein GWI33_007377 [Rhynchophorus ferrugineus]|uniref:Uncharacterized protein n=1 Tax=Rhynchophorus ferrugineus TaxID=354439 RepID=A0A834IS88_RHYFE|nr:hypothetical protein GWI33_007377 [Rhynchophorus ferrugineus]